MANYVSPSMFYQEGGVNEGVMTPQCCDVLVLALGAVVVAAGLAVWDAAAAINVAGAVNAVGAVNAAVYINAYGPSC